MALGTITVIDDHVRGNKDVRIRDVQLTSGANYTTGGETVSPAAVGLGRITAANVLSQPAVADGSSHRVCSVLYQANGSVKLVCGGAAVGAEVAANTNLSTFSTRIEFSGSL